MFLETYDGELKGLEASVPNPTNISLSTTLDLWNDTDTMTFVNMDRIMVWYGAMTDATLQTLLIATFGLTLIQLPMLLAWLGNFIINITSIILFKAIGYTIKSLYEIKNIDLKVNSLEFYNTF